MKKINAIYKNMVDKFIVNRLKKGDIILISTSDNFISWLIQKFTDSVWSHVGIYIGQSQWIEATMPKVKTSNIYSLVSQYSYRKFKVLRLKKGLDFELQNIIVNGAKKCIGLRYDILGNLGQALSILLGKLYFLNHLQLRKAYYCSELAGKCFSKIGIKFIKGKDYHITPEDIAKSKKLKVILDFYKGAN